ncbi:HNH endonuclease [Methylosinus sp. PW1]|uniref:HNH endonuclease n=1 Tax=Methylosinus sp. PW1 TaxID=107636 RepID=UPI000A8064DE|nr:HNH endonuclease [Methylosinus sp. PW1]
MCRSLRRNIPTRAIFILLGIVGILGAADARQSRSGRAREAFRRANPCPSTGLTTGPCPDYVIDHDEPLCAGGEDAPGNMRWQEEAEAAEKDGLERAVCRAMRAE